MQRLAGFALVMLGCSVSSTPPPTPPKPQELIAFTERPDGLLSWDFEVHGLPATDPRTGAIVVADVSHGHIASSLSLTLRWLRPREDAPRTFAVLAPSEASHVLYELDDAPEVRTALAATVRTRTRTANAVLAAGELRPTIACAVQPIANGRCAHPQRFTCGSVSGDLSGDRVVWRDGDETSSMATGWTLAPMTIGDGPPKEMITCLTEAHLDPVTHVLAARIEQSCKGGGSDACYYPEEWRAVALTPP